MNISKYIAFAAVAAVATGAFAGSGNNTLVHFLTTGNDKYEDGEPVKDGEWYACCWSADGVFEGITKDYKPLDPNDKVFEMQPSALNGKCTYTMFQIDSSIAPKSGKYCVILLDTREGGKGAVAGGETQPERPSNSAIAIVNYTVSVTAGKPDADLAKSDVKNPGWGATDPQPEMPAKIVKIDPAGDDVVIEIDDLYPGVRYDLKAGAEPTKLTTYALEVPVSGTEKESARVVLPKNETKFYKLTTAPMTK